MNNISSIISGHNKNLLNPNVTQYGCNCRIRGDCPLQNQCLTPNIMYRVDVHCKANKDNYILSNVYLFKLNNNRNTRKSCEYVQSQQ